MSQTDRRALELAALIPFSEAIRLDAELVRLARGESALRLAIGSALDAFAAVGGHHELGFSSFEAYARERCTRSGRWAADTRWLAQKLEALPRIRDALRAGALGWSTAELLARHVSPENERTWLEQAQAMTVRELRKLLASETKHDTHGDINKDEEENDDEATCTLRMSVSREDAWLFECTRKVAQTVAGRTSADDVLQTLLAEGLSTLLELVPEDAREELHDLEELEHEVAHDMERQAAWHGELGRWRDEAEELCKESCTSAGAEPRASDASEFTQPAKSQSPEALDRTIKQLCSELAERDLALGIVAEQVRKADVWRRFGFASETQYARERVGVSRSSLKAKRVLAARCSRLPKLANALSSGRIGYEAAYLLSRVATPKTTQVWLRLAERRTVKHLREEVEAAELLVRMGNARDQLPLDEASLADMFELERRIVSGGLFGRTVDTKAGEGAQREAAGAQGEARASTWLAGQMSGAPRPAFGARKLGCVTLRWCLRRETRRFFRALERVFVRVSSRIGAPSGFLRFLCENFCRIWLPALRRERLTDSGAEPEYFDVYRRDLFRCTSPVCVRRDITPHHLRFRSCGGGDDDENVTTLCVWCHLRGVHEGRIGAEPPASRIHWRIGRRGTLYVEGRVLKVA